MVRHRASLARSCSSSCYSGRQVVQNPGELPLPLNRHFPDRQMQGEDSAVAPHALHITSDPDDPGVPFPEITLEVTIVFVAIGRRHEHGHITAHDLGFGVPEQPLGGGVERFDLTVGIDDDNAIHRRFDNRAPAQLHGPTQPLVLGDLRDIARDDRRANHFASRTPHR